MIGHGKTVALAVTAFGLCILLLAALIILTVDLGKYATTVLSAYGVSLVLLAALISLTWHQNSRSKTRLAALEADRNA